MVTLKIPAALKLEAEQMLHATAIALLRSWGLIHCRLCHLFPVCWCDTKNCAQLPGALRPVPALAACVLFILLQSVEQQRLQPG